MLALYMSFIDDESHRRLFEKIYIEYRDPMFFMARSVLGNDSDAEDIVHDVFLKIAKKHMARISRIKNDTDLRNYLLTAVEKICNNIEYERILSAIVSMKDIYKEVMYYHFVMDLSIPEVAKMLNCKVSTVKQRLVRGKKLLYAQLFGGESNDSRE